jgi:hypothetical protein
VKHSLGILGVKNIKPYSERTTISRLFDFELMELDKKMFRFCKRD